VNCKTWQDPTTLQWYNYYYPQDDTTQYLYETYPGHITPIEGITNEHFIVWMRTAAIPTFRKLYGRISGPFKKGDVLVFGIQANYEVASYSATKSLVISTVGELGGRNPYLGTAYVVVGALSLMFGSLFALKQAVSPRPIGEPSLIPWRAAQEEES